jgi:EAL domain-containing protein (putative c-di-GMP-specific phosphodiesterase class I)
MKDVESTLLTLAQLKSRGVRIAIDDFGTGYSSLKVLKCLPIDALKIDRSFIGEITGCSSEALVADSIISLARILKFHVIAEGVETEAQHSYLRSRGCDRVQGHLFSKPVPAGDIEMMIQRDQIPKRSACIPQGNLYLS